MARVFRLGWWTRVRAVDVPAVAPYLNAACRVGIGLAWKAGVAAEVIGVATGSIGEQLCESKLFIDSAGLFAWTAVVLALSVVSEAVVVHLLAALTGMREVPA